MRKKYGTLLSEQPSYIKRLSASADLVTLKGLQTVLISYKLEASFEKTSYRIRLIKDTKEALKKDSSNHTKYSAT